mgnify:CR=1 FL=1
MKKRSKPSSTQPTSRSWKPHGITSRQRNSEFSSSSWRKTHPKMHWHFLPSCMTDAPKEQASETVSISENEIYFKRQPLTEEQKKHGSYVDENGNLHVKNLSAFWIPELTTTEKVGHTTYTVTGSYEGKESFLKKLERIVAKNAQQKFEDEGADE